MNTLFVAVLVIAGIALVLVAVLMWRARRGPAMATKKPAKRRRWVDLRDALRRRYAVLERAVRYVTALHDWRYRSSWLLLMGEAGAGKSSLAMSIPDGLRRRRVRGDARHVAYLQAAAAHTRWHALEQGMLIDPDGFLAGPAGDAEADARWKGSLADIDSLRPDRALDGMLWVVSAERLLAADAATLQAMARHAFARVHQVQEAFAFALPVYVVVTHCDTVQGFDAFWSAQPEPLRAQMVGWSSPTIEDNGQPVEWVAAAFDRLTVGLRALVLDAAAERDRIEDVDGFFLFPRFMAALKAPLQQFLGVVFKPNTYETRAFCRGIYFTGAIGGAQRAVEGARTDIAFIEELLREKVFAERRLGQRTRKGVLARNVLVRRLQIGIAAIGLALALVLPWTGHRIRQQTHAMRDTVIDIAVTADNLKERGCLDADAFHAVIGQVAALDMRTRYPAVPLSWMDRRIEDGVYGLVSREALGKVVFPALACQLQRRIEAQESVALQPKGADADPAAAFADDRSQLQAHLDELVALETNLGRFARLSRPGLRSQQRSLVEDLAEVSHYIYGRSFPEAAMRPDSALSVALVETTYAQPPTIAAAARQQLAHAFGGMAGQASSDMLRRVSAGVEQLQRLQSAQPPVTRPLRAFNTWLAWIRGSWLMSTAMDNPCRNTLQALQPDVQTLVDTYHYGPAMFKALDPFGESQCYSKAVAQLAQASVPPYDALFEVDPHGQQLRGVNPELSREAEGLAALANLGFMQRDSLQAFHCQADVAGWRADAFGQVLAELRTYQGFEQAHPSAAGDQAPLYERLAQAQLQASVADILARNQRSASADRSAYSGPDASPAAEQRLSAQSRDLSASVGTMLQALQQMRQANMDALAGNVGQCARNYASGALQDASALAASSHLYDPSVQPAGDAADAVFDLGPPAVLQAYLGRQLDRVQVLAGYAAPFVTLLDNTQGVNDSQRDNTQTAGYWNATIDALNQALQFSDPSGQAARLQDLFTKQLAPMSYANCATVLADYDPPQTGNDLFSARRQAMLDVARMACDGHGRQGADLHYYRIAMLFNSQLAGRYPFGPRSAHDAGAATVKAFFAYYAGEKPELESWLKTAKGAKAQKIGAFVRQLDAVQAFFAGNLSATPQSAAIQVDAGFRALPSRSPQGNQLIGWTLQAGSEQASWPGTTTELSWSFGQACSLQLQWADRSRFMPLPDAGQADLSVQGDQARFQADGPWALLRMIDAHRSTADGDALAADQLLLAFQVPVTRRDATASATAASAPTPFYLTLTLATTDPKTKAKASIALPAFPTHAPQTW